MKNPLLPLGLAALGLLVFLTAPAARGSDTFSPTMNNLGAARRNHTATVLADDTVLVAGGLGTSAYLQGAELYDPATGLWTPTTALNTPRAYHTATLLPSGLVLVVGGFGNAGADISAELYDPVARTWTATGSLARARYYHTATLLPNGKVLVAGGFGNVQHPGGEVYDPVTGLWTDTGPAGTDRHRHTATLLPSGKVLVTGGQNPLTNALPVAAELYDPATNAWTATGSLSTGGRFNHSATLLPGGQVLVAGGQRSATILASAELYNPVAGTWSATGSLGTQRQLHTATLLAGGRVLVAGGSDDGGPLAVRSAEIYDPAYDPASGGTWRTTGPLITGRQEFTATLLARGQVLVAGGKNGNSMDTAEVFDPAPVIGPLTTARTLGTATLLHTGKVLVVGGSGGSGIQASAELYDPATGTWSATGSLATARRLHTATMLPNGQVLVAGGNTTGNIPLASAELYDPATGTWSGTASLTGARAEHTATLLASGRVLVAGGTDASGYVLSTAIYDPAGNGGAGSWTASLPTNTPRKAHTATLLPGGKVLVAGGAGVAGYLTSAELYDPTDGSTGSWSATGSLAGGRAHHTATLLPNGKVLLWGGLNPPDNVALPQLYDPSAGTWQFAGAGASAVARSAHTASLLPNGKVLLAGGLGSSGGFLASMDLYDPVADSSTTATLSLTTARAAHTATLLPSGTVLVAGGTGSGGFLASAEFYDSAVGGWGSTGSMTAPRHFHTATLLHTGKVLVVGGGASGYFHLQASAELYDPATGTWSATGSLATARQWHTATLLPNGKVLVAGGDTYNSDGSESAELYDPGTGVWTATGSLATFGYNHTATLLPSGKVLVAGGDRYDIILPRAELYDPATGLWTATGSLAAARNLHTATLLPEGMVLVAGNQSYPFDESGGAELYDPGTGVWTATGSLATARVEPTATLLPSGKVLAAGGLRPNYYLPSAELYDPAGNGGAGSWSPTGSLATTRWRGTVTLLPSGKVLAAGGDGDGSGSAELYNPGTGTWTATGSLATARFDHTATLLASGKVLVVGGSDGTTYLSSAELYDVGLGFLPAWQPAITSATFDALGRLVLTGTGFRGISSASGGNGSQDSATSYPVVQLRRLDNEQSVFLLSDPATSVSATAFTSAPVAGFPPGYALVTVFANGIPSAAFGASMPTADIVVVRPGACIPCSPTPVTDTIIADGGSVSLGALLTTPGTRTFTIMNPGGITLTGLTITTDGPDAGDFTVTASPTAPVHPGGSTTFTIQFAPTAYGAKTATLHIASNVPWKNPYDINLTGHALTATTDTDGDGMSDAEEFLLECLGFDWEVPQPALVAKLYANANGLGLYTAAQVQTLNIGVPLIQKDVVTGRFKLTIGVQKTPDLATVPFAAFPFDTPGATTVINGATGKLEFEFTVPDNAAFFRLQAQ